MINETHDPSLTSWVEAANSADALFPLQNLPFASVRRQGSDAAFRGGVAIGDFVLDLAELHKTGVVSGTAADALEACVGSTLNPFMTLGKDAWSTLRFCLSRLLRAGQEDTRVQACLIPIDHVEYALPAEIGDYTDFYTSIHHATNIGRLFRPDNPLLPNYQWLPIGYHGRSSSIGVSGQSFPRPVGQTRPPDQDEPVVAPCKRLDYEMEVGIFIGSGNEIGSAIDISVAEDHVFGLCLLNDWSARDIQAWEYQPLGPFLAKNFASTISPWIVTMEALAPFRASWTRESGHPQPLPYLNCESNSESGSLDVRLEVLLLTERMRQQETPPVLLSKSNFTDAYWTVAQMVAHHTVNGCNLCAGDLFGSGTMSGAQVGSQAALIEITEGGARPINLPNGETRTFLEDGDTVIMRGVCERAGAVSIGFGEVVGSVLPARFKDS